MPARSKTTGRILKRKILSVHACGGVVVTGALALVGGGEWRA